MVRYPSIRVSLRTPNPLLLVAAIRAAMRQAGLDRDEIAEFSTAALSLDPEGARQVCAQWVDTVRQ